MKFFKRSSFILLALLGFSQAGNSQVCIPTYGTVCFSDFTDDIIDNFWTEGGVVDIINMDTDCCMLPDNYWNTGLAVSACPGATITTNVQCQLDAFDQGFAIWIDWNQNDIFEAAEKEYESPGWGDEVWTGSFTVPADAPTGESYKMRVRSKYASPGSDINPCDNQTYGETEDYLVVIASCAPTICEGDTIELDLGPMPPGPLTYSWSPATEISDPTGGPTVDVWPSDSTLYICTVTTPDSTFTVEKEVYVVFPAFPDAGLDDSICHDPAVGYAIDATIAVPESSVFMDWELNSFVGPGAPLLIFSPSESSLDPTIQVSEPGVYEFIFTTNDVAGVCPEESDTVLITYSEQTHELDSINPACFGGMDGTIIVTGTGTLPTADYSLDGGPWQVSNVFTGLSAGTYTVTSRDIIGCEYESEIELLDPEEVVITVSSDTLICQNGTATVSASATGGTDFTYNWSIDGADDGAVQDISPTEDVAITVTAYNEAGCASSEATIMVTLRAPITLLITANDSICPTFDSESFVTALGGDDAYTYVWTANGIPMADTDAMINTNPEVTTEYCVTVSDGCETTPVTICNQAVMRPVPAPAFTSDVTWGCIPATANFNAVIDPTDEVIWTMDGRSFTNVSDVMHEFTAVGLYDVTLEITNQYGCYASFTANDYFEVIDVPHPEFFINPNPTTIFNTEVTLTPTDDGNVNTYSWEIPGGSPANSTDESPVVVYPEGIPDDYPVDLTVTNEYGCQTTVSNTVHIVSDVIIYAPNTFTPDGDNFNETWRIHIDGIDFYDYHCVIFNRWGEIVWESYDASASWTGTYGTDIAPDGVYIWTVTAKEGTTDKKLNFNGYINLMR